MTVYLVVVNIVALVLMRVDKSRAIRHAWRIPEACLFGAALLGGSIGSILGMILFRHKTRHLSFLLGMPAILIVQVLLYALLF